MNPINLSLLPEKTVPELKEIKNKLVVDLFNCSLEWLYPTSLSLITVLLELLKRDLLELLNSIPSEEINSEENMKKSYICILKYSNYWNSIVSYSELSDARGEDTISNSNNKSYFYSVLKANNPYVYALFLEALDKISKGQLEMEL